MLDAWFKPRTIVVPEIRRSREEQADVDARTANLALYHYDSCMFCARVRKAIAALQLQIELRDIHADRDRLRELVAGGGRTTVPCLRIESPDTNQVEWLYESADIIAWLVERFGDRD